MLFLEVKSGLKIDNRDAIKKYELKGYKGSSNSAQEVLKKSRINWVEIQMKLDSICKIWAIGQMLKRMMCQDNDLHVMISDKVAGVIMTMMKTQEWAARIGREFPQLCQ